MKKYRWTDGETVLGVFSIDKDNDVWEYTPDYNVPIYRQPLFVEQGQWSKEDIKNWAIDRTPEYCSVHIESFYTRNQEAIDNNDRVQIFLNEKGRFDGERYYLDEIVE